MFFSTLAGDVPEYSGTFPLGPAQNLSTMLAAQTGSGSWVNRYWKSNEQIVNNGDYVEFIITELNYGTVFGVGTSGIAPTGDFQGMEFMLWPFSQSTAQFAVMVNGSLAAWVSLTTWNITDRFRIRRSGTDLIVSQNGVDVYTHSGGPTGPLYAQVSAQSGDGSVAVDSINGQPVTTKLVQNFSVVAGVPTVDTYCNDSDLYFSQFNWLEDALVKRKETAQPDAYFKFRFRGPNCAIIYDWSKVGLSAMDTAIAYRVDNGAWQYHTPSDPGQNQLQIASGLHVGVHTVDVAIQESQLGRRIHAESASRTASVYFWGVRVPNAEGSEVLPAILKTNNCLIYGDSNSEGAEALNTRGHAQLAFSRELARLIDAEHGLVSFPGQGWITTPGLPVPTFENGWDLRSDLGVRTLTPEPDYIFIIHGQNDVPGDLHVQATVAELLAATSTAKIFVCCPISLHQRAYLEAQVTAINHPRVLYLDNAQNIGALYPGVNGATHVAAAGHLVYANNLHQRFLTALGLGGGIPSNAYADPSGNPYVSPTGDYYLGN